MALVVTGCGSSSPSASSTTVGAARLLGIVPAPAGVVAGTTQGAETWVLAGSGSSKSLSLIDSAGAVTATVRVSVEADSMAESSSELVAVGEAGATSGKVVLYEGRTGNMVATVAVGAPVRALAFSASGRQLFVLGGTTSSTDVSIVDTATDSVTSTVSAPRDAVGLAADPSQPVVYTATADDVELVPMGSGSASALFPVGGPGTALAVSPQGTFLYVLKGPATVRNVAVVNLATESVVTVVPAAADSVAIALSGNGRKLYDFVGTPTIGNVQLESLPSGAY